MNYIETIQHEFPDIPKDVVVGIFFAFHELYKNGCIPRLSLVEALRRTCKSYMTEHTVVNRLHEDLATKIFGNKYSPALIYSVKELDVT